MFPGPHNILAGVRWSAPEVWTRAFYPQIFIHLHRSCAHSWLRLNFLQLSHKEDRTCLGCGGDSQDCPHVCVCWCWFIFRLNQVRYVPFSCSIWQSAIIKRTLRGGGGCSCSTANYMSIKFVPWNHSKRDWLVYLTCLFIEMFGHGWWVMIRNIKSSREFTKSVHGVNIRQMYRS